MSSSRGVKITTIDNTNVYLNPEFVVMVTPMQVDGAISINQCIVHVMGAKLPVSGSVETVANQLWGNHAHLL